MQDGLLKAEDTLFSVASETRSRHFLGRSVLLGSHFTGILDDFNLWSVARTKAEISTSLTSLPPPNTAGLQLQFLFNELENTIYDSSGNGKDVVDSLLCEGDACRVPVTDSKIQCGDGARGGLEV